MTKLTEAPIRAFDRIVERKGLTRRARLKRIRRAVDARYNVYTQLDTIAPSAFRGVARETLLHCYESSTAPLALVKADLRAAQPHRRCPYCGVSTAHEFDHYVPKELAPEYAVCHWNLIYSCGLCNGRKGVHWTPGARAVIHSYLDDMPYDKQWLFATVCLLGDGAPAVEFRLDIPVGTSAGAAALLARHFERLGLLALYGEQAPTLFDLVEDWTATLSAADLADELVRVARRKSKRYGRNHWESVGLVALSTAPAAVDWLASRLSAR